MSAPIISGEVWMVRPKAVPPAVRPVLRRRWSPETQPLLHPYPCVVAPALGICGAVSEADSCLFALCAKDVAPATIEA
jgi:hypothetical protein